MQLLLSIAVTLNFVSNKVDDLQSSKKRVKCVGELKKQNSKKVL